MRIDVRGQHLELSQALQEFVTRRLTFALRRFRTSIAGIDARVIDENGPRGGIDTKCRLLVSLAPSGSILVEGRGRDANTAVAEAISRLTHFIRRHLDRRRSLRFGLREQT